jgi:UDP-glucose-4-epimerase GalE
MDFPWSGMKVLVTGGAGYVGSHALRALKRSGHDVVVYDNLCTGYRQLAKDFELVVGDLSDRARLEPALRGMDAVMHFAAHAYVGESVENPRKYFRNNVDAALALLNASIDAGVRTFVFSSTCAVYGIPSRVPIPEDTVRDPVNPYGVTKLLFERALEAYDRAYQLRFAALRYFNAAGADPAENIGELHDPETHLIPLALAAAAGTRSGIDIYGEDYPTSDGTCIRDYIHVNDLAEAHVRAMEYLASGGESVALNLGTGRGYSVKEVLAEVEKVTGRTLKRRTTPRRPGDPPALVADPSRAQQKLNWCAQRSLNDIVDTAWKWMLMSNELRVQ